MKQWLRELIKRTPLYPVLRRWANDRRQMRKLAEWEKQGRPAPPPDMIKQRTIRDFGRRFGLTVLVETGTLHGEMADTMKPYFNRIYSIELGKDLYEKAKQRFEGDRRIEIIHGDSGTELGNLLPRIGQPALFWLDAHYSGGVTVGGGSDTPIYKELTHIFDSRQRGHVIIIDDARCFGIDPAYPTIEALRAFIMARRPDASIEIANDSIRVIPDGSNPTGEAIRSS